MVATLGLGIGGTTAVFSVVRAVLLAPLPYEAPGRLVRFYQQEPDKPSTRHYLTGVHFGALREHASSFEEVAALDTYYETGATCRDGTSPAAPRAARDQRLLPTFERQCAARGSSSRTSGARAARS